MNSKIIQKAVTEANLVFLSSSGPGPKTCPWANTKFGLPLTTHHHPANFLLGDNHSKPLLNEF